MSLSLKLLGEFALRDGNGAALSLPTRKTRALLGYLAANADKPQPRERLMALLWSTFGEKQARHNLNQALLSLRKLGVPLDSDGERVTLPGAAIEVDLARFRACLDNDPAAAAKLYDGTLLDGFMVPDPAFEDWLSTARSELHSQTCLALEHAVDVAAGDGDTAAATELAQRLVALDPLREDAYRRLMRLLHDSGDRPGALRQYQACAELLKKELQVEPDSATKALYEEIRKGNASTSASEIGPARDAPSTETPPSHPDKPSIAVLPFVNVSGDPEQEYFADGMTEDLITCLSQFRSLFVIARNSTFSYKGTSPDVREVAQDLGVRYILEGSVRRSGERIRITSQLIEADSGKHLWAQRYDRKLDDIFAVQDEVTAEIVAAIAPEIEEAERILAQRKPPGSLDIWSRFQLGLAACYMTTKEALESAVARFDEINALDPTFAPAFAYGVLARFRLLRHFNWMNKELIDQAREKARLAIALDPKDPDCLMAVSRVYTNLGQHEVAISKAEEALSLNPNSAMASFLLGFVLGRAGRCEEAIIYLDRAIRLSPHDIFSGGFFGVKAVMLFQIGRYQESADWGQRSITSPNPRPLAFVYLLASLIKLERKEEAATLLADLLRLTPEITLGEIREKITFQYPGAGQAAVILFDALREAGMPE